MGYLVVRAGRLLLTALHVPLRHDLYVAAAGCYALWAVARLLGGMQSLATSPSMAGVKCTVQTLLSFCKSSCLLHQWCQALRILT